DSTLAPNVAEAARDARLAEAVTRALGKLGAPAGRELLAKMATLSMPAQSAAAEALVQLADASLVDPLAELARSEVPDLASSALRALGRTQSARAIDVLVPLLDGSEHATGAAKALVSLAETFRAPVLDALERSVAAKPSAAGVLALARVGGAAALPTLRRTLRHEDAAIRAASAEAAGDVGTDAACELARL